MRFLKNMYDWLFKPDYIGFPVVRTNQFGTEYQTMCWHSRVEWWYWQGIFFIVKIWEYPNNLNQRLLKKIKEDWDRSGKPYF